MTTTNPQPSVVAEQAEDQAYRDGWAAAVAEDFDAQPPAASNEVREAWYQGFRGGTRHLATQRNLERARQATAKTADHLEQVDGEWVRQTVDAPENFIQVPEPANLADKVAEQIIGLADEHGWEVVAEAAKQLAADEGPARTPDGVPADGAWHRNPVTGETQRAVLA